MLSAFLALPPEHLTLLRLVADEAAARGLPAYLVGGVPRDLLLGRKSTDFDIVVVGNAIPFARALARKHGGRATVHEKFGTAVWIRPILDDSIFDAEKPNIEYRISNIDLISARRETYAHPAALPDVTPSTLDDDLQRRDFTINTLAIRLDGEHFAELYDPFNGAADIAAGIIRVLHSGSFLDDPTRIFRAVRYEQRYGFTIAPETLALVPAAQTQVAVLSAERVRHELDLVLEEPNAASMLARLEALGILKAVEKALPWGQDLRERLEAGLSASAAPEWDLTLRYAGVPFKHVLGFSLWLLDLSPAEIDAIQARLAFPSAVLESVRAAARLRVDLPALSESAPSKWVERLRGVPLTAIYAVFLVSGEKALETYASHWQHIHPQTNGETLKVLGLPPGPAYKKILQRLHNAWLDGEVTSAEQENILLQKLLSLYPKIN